MADSVFEQIVAEACKEAAAVLRHRLIDASDEAIEVVVREAITTTRERVYDELGGE